MIFLSVPYTHIEPEVRRVRTEHATRVMAKLMSDGHVVCCPVVMYHGVDELMTRKGTTPSSEYWLGITDNYIDVCDELVVLQLNGWDKSAGVKREIERFAEREIEPRFMKAV